MKCHRTGCTSPAEYHVGLEVYCIATAHRRQHIMAPTTIKVCGSPAHMEAAARYILSPLNKSNIVRTLTARGYSMPDFASAEVVFPPIRAAQNDWAAAGKHDLGSRGI